MYAHSAAIVPLPMTPTHSQAQSRGVHHHARAAYGTSAHHCADTIAPATASGIPIVAKRGLARRDVIAAMTCDTAPTMRRNTSSGSNDMRACCMFSV
jgi:hypothetical protein